jgi:hypothetical protein
VREGVRGARCEACAKLTRKRKSAQAAHATEISTPAADRRLHFDIRRQPVSLAGIFELFSKRFSSFAVISLPPAAFISIATLLFDIFAFGCRHSQISPIPSVSSPFQPPCFSRYYAAIFSADDFFFRKRCFRRL